MTYSGDMNEQQYYNAMGGDRLFGFLHATSDETEDEKNRRLGLFGGDSAGVNRSGLTGTPAKPREQADLNIAPDADTIPYASSQNRRGRGGDIEEPNPQSTIGSFLPTPAAGTTNPEPDNSHNPERHNQEAHTTGMDMGQSLEQSSSGADTGKGDSEDRPTYDGKANMKGQIMTKVIDAMSDVMSRYLLKGDNRRHLKAAGWGVGNVIPKVMGGDTQTAMNRIGFANSFMADPRAAVVGGAMSMIKGRLDQMDGTNPFEAESNEMNKGATQFNYDADSRSQKIRDIGLFRGIDTYITKSLEGDSLVEKAKNYLTAEARRFRRS